jgi:hypothetical protein
MGSIVNSILSFFSALTDILKIVGAYMLGKERQKRKEMENVAKLKEEYEEAEEKNKEYRDGGKSGLLDRVREFQDDDSK